MSVIYFNREERSTDLDLGRSGESENESAQDGESADRSPNQSRGDEVTDLDLDRSVEENQGPLDIMVSFDGTWHKRGFTSNYGVGVVIDVMTGLVLDYEVLSKYCQACCMKDVERMTDFEKDQWQREHGCSQNFSGSSKAMEKEAAVRMWSRSIEKHNMRYTRRPMLSDGG